MAFRALQKLPPIGRCGVILCATENLGASATTKILRHPTGAIILRQPKNSFAFSAPLLMAKKKKLSNEDWKKKLSDDEYYVSREGGTEPPFTGKYVNNELAGTYLCNCCKTPLFSSETKFESGTGWPSFNDSIYEDGKTSLVTRTDSSHGMVRVEVLCGDCNAHLGHVFNDGPEPTGLRYCINSLSLDFKQAS